MATDTDKPAKSESATVPSTSVAASAERPAAKPVARPRAGKAAAPAAKKPAGKRTPVAAKAATGVAKKAVAGPAVRKSPVAKNAAHEAKPFAAKVNKADKPAKVKKAKLVRDSFTMPELEYAQITALKKRCLNAGVSAKKSEILRAAVASLAKLNDTSLLAAVRRLDVIKTGRPAKGSK